MKQPRYKVGRKTVPFRPGKDSDNLWKMEGALRLWIADYRGHAFGHKELAATVKMWKLGLINLSVDKAEWKKLNRMED